MNKGEPSTRYFENFQYQEKELSAKILENIQNRERELVSKMREIAQKPERESPHKNYKDTDNKIPKSIERYS